MRLIDADALKKAFKKSPFVNEVHLYYARQLINLAPTVKRHGEWVFDSSFTAFGNPYGTYKCSACGGHSANKYSFCKDCGADMREGEAE